MRENVEFEHKPRYEEQSQHMEGPLARSGAGAGLAIANTTSPRRSDPTSLRPNSGFSSLGGNGVHVSPTSRQQAPALITTRTGGITSNFFPLRRSVPTNLRPSSSYHVSGGNKGNTSQTSRQDAQQLQSPDNEPHHGSPIRDSQNPQLETQQGISKEAASSIQPSARSSPPHGP
ncbi:hypothetical protein R1flu_023171 [Riccia fluitans]|uniref:Uncharacterized protein n=1 Tax=Riccia fluitans TaxID=41844 RepID=A0ABD1XRA1_9MARC